MTGDRKPYWLRWDLWLILFFSLWLVHCSPQAAGNGTNSPGTVAVDKAESEEHHDDEKDIDDTHAKMLPLPDLEEITLNGRPLKVVATTSIIGDVVGQIGGDLIELTVLMDPGQDPHSYEPGPQELTAVADADVIFVNGWDLEEGLIRDLASISEDAPLVPISSNIIPLSFIENEVTRNDANENQLIHGHIDPHVWFSIQNVVQWAENVLYVLSDLDPANSETYVEQADIYKAELAQLAIDVENLLSQIPEERRYLVTNHNSFQYLARDYHFEILGTIFPTAGTLTEPSASNLTIVIAYMKAHNLCTIFTETTMNDDLAQTAANELTVCDDVQVLSLYTGALGPTGSGADSYISMFRANIETIVNGLRQT